MLQSFFTFILGISLIKPNLSTQKSQYCSPNNPIIIVGSGLAGHAAAASALSTLKSTKLKNNLPKIIILEKEPKYGGNSMKATSGINGVNTIFQNSLNITDNISIFKQDTMKSALNSKENNLKSNKMIDTLANNAGNAVNWLKNEFNLDLISITQCGGHSIPRTHKFVAGPVGNIIVKTIHNAIENEVEFIYNAKLTDIIMDDETKQIIGVKYTKNSQTIEQYASSVIFTMGGFGNDHTSDSLLNKYSLNNEYTLPTTNGNWATGDGIKIASKNGIQLIDMSEIQIHPTGFINPKDPDNKTKFLAPEALRGVGGIIIDNNGKRFVNELDLRKIVSNAMNNNKNKPFRLILNQKSADMFGKNLGFYLKFGLMKKYSNINELSNDIKISSNILETTINEYINCGKIDEFGKNVFPNRDGFKENSILYVGMITPVIHYTMGGIKIDENTRVIDINDDIIQGFFAAGEVTGGVHGKNRLAGNSLLECVVFGRIAGKNAVERCYYDELNKDEL